MSLITITFILQYTDGHFVEQVTYDPANPIHIFDLSSITSSDTFLVSVIVKDLDGSELFSTTETIYIEMYVGGPGILH